MASILSRPQWVKGNWLISSPSRVTLHTIYLTIQRKYVFVACAVPAGGLAPLGHLQIKWWQNCGLANPGPAHEGFVGLFTKETLLALQWRHNGRDGASNHQPHHYILNRLFRSRSKKTSKLRVTGLCAGVSPVTGEFPTQMTNNA